MPQDIWLEMFRLLRPQDLLHLARTSKAIRAVLMRRPLSGIWRNARKCLAISPPIPEPMTGVSEPAWISLLFEKHCRSCLVKQVRIIDFTFYTRLCSSCKQTELMTEHEIERTYPGTEAFCYLCPRKTMPGPRHRKGEITFRTETKQPHYVLRDVIATERRWHALNEEERVLFEQERLRSLTEMDSEVRMCERWVKNKAAFRAGGREKLRLERAAAIFQKLNGLGYEHELQSLGERFNEHPHVNRSSSLTEKGELMLQLTESYLTLNRYANLDEHVRRNDSVDGRNQGSQPRPSHRLPEEHRRIYLGHEHTFRVLSSASVFPRLSLSPRIPPLFPHRANHRPPNQRPGGPPHLHSHRSPDPSDVPKVARNHGGSRPPSPARRPCPSRVAALRNLPQARCPAPSPQCFHMRVVILQWDPSLSWSAETWMQPAGAVGRSSSSTLEARAALESSRSQGPFRRLYPDGGPGS